MLTQFSELPSELATAVAITDGQRWCRGLKEVHPSKCSAWDFNRKPRPATLHADLSTDIVDAHSAPSLSASWELPYLF